MKSRFIPEDGSGLAAGQPDTLVHPDPYDASEEQFAASLERRPAPRFVVDEEGLITERVLEQDPERHPEASPAQPTEDISSTDPSRNGAAEPVTSQETDSLPCDAAWRQEVAAKLSRYRARRRVPLPRYPSLQLRFEVPEPPGEENPVAPPPAPTRLALAIQEIAPEPQAPPVEDSSPAPAETGEAKILEFPRFFSAPRLTLDELAEPVFDQPRILEVPEQMPPPPALGGILIEPEEKIAAARRPGFELPLNPPSMARRLTAGLIDLLIVSISLAAFADMFFRVTGTVPPFRQAAGVCAGLVAVVWIVYQYLFLVYPGATPGLKLTRLQLSRFDGTPAPRSLRRWRVLASVLSGLSLALGYAWCFFDEDRLCWHDRITRTYMAPRPAGTKPPV
jgi:uncharacterized RDD family membrane protein YckC